MSPGISPWSVRSFPAEFKARRPLRQSAAPTDAPSAVGSLIFRLLVVRLFVAEKALHSPLVEEVELVARTDERSRVAIGSERADNG